MTTRILVAINKLANFTLLKKCVVPQRGVATLLSNALAIPPHVPHMHFNLPRLSVTPRMAHATLPKCAVAIPQAAPMTPLLLRELHAGHLPASVTLRRCVMVLQKRVLQTDSSQEMFAVLPQEVAMLQRHAPVILLRVRQMQSPQLYAVLPRASVILPRAAMA